MPPAHPHFEYPQLRQVAQPSMITTALALHLWHMVAEGGKLAPSPVTAMVSLSSISDSRPWVGSTGASGFFFERFSKAARFSALSARRSGPISGSWILTMDVRWSSTMLPKIGRAEGGERGW